MYIAFSQITQLIIFTDNMQQSSRNTDSSWISKFPLVENPKVFNTNHPEQCKDPVEGYRQVNTERNEGTPYIPFIYYIII